MNEELEVDTLKDILSKFAGRMGAKWDFIGIQLRQGDLVQDLRSSPQLGRQKVQHIIDEWLGSEDEDVPVCAATVSRVLRSDAVRLGAVARDFEKMVAEKLRKKSSQRAAEQRPASHPPHEDPPSGAYPSAGTSTSYFEGAMSFADGPSPKPQGPPPNISSVPQEPPPNTSSVPRELHPSQPSAPSSLPLSQQVEEGRPKSQPPDGGGQADSGPVEGVGSLVQQPVEEHGQTAQGDVQRGPGQDEDEVHDAPVIIEEDVLEATMRHITGVLQDHYCRRLGNEAAMEKSFGQRSLPFHEQARIASAVCRTFWQIQIEGNSKFHGSGSIVSCNGKFYLLTCCHNFLKKADGDKLQDLGDVDVEREMKRKCKRAKYFFSTRDFKSTVALKADVVLTNREDPVLIFDKVKDLLAVEVNDPADFPAHLGAEEAASLLPIQPIPLQPGLSRESLLKRALLLTVVHFPWEDGHRAECLELAVGLRLMQQECQETQVVYTFDTYHGSSGSSVLFVEEGEIVLLAVHRKSTEARMRDQTGTLTSVGYNTGSVLTQDFLKRLNPDDQNEPERSV